MRRLTLKYIEGLIGTGLGVSRPPAPMPGKRWPTRVAWHLEVRQSPFGKGFVTTTLTYIGKPNRYRALEAFKFLKQAGGEHNVNTILGYCWQAEFDKNGLIAYRAGGDAFASPAFFAYHPHNARVDIVEAFMKPVFVKYVGGMRLYSYKKRLTQEAVDAYYEWFHKTFKRKLRRPKAQPTAVIGGEIVEF
jgi:hypothetical protein